MLESVDHNLPARSSWNSGGEAALCLVGACHGVGLFEGTRVKGLQFRFRADPAWRFRQQGAVLESPGPKLGAMFFWESDGFISHVRDFIFLLFC